MQRLATSVPRYLSSLPADRRAELARVRRVVRSRIPKGFEEGILYGMIGWYIPLSRYPVTYNGQPLAVAGLAAQKHHNALYLMTVYGNPKLEKAFRAGFKAAGKKLDMGKSCVRFKTADALALDVIADTIGKVKPADLIAMYERSRSGSMRGARAAANKAKPRPAAKRPAARKPAAKKPAAKKPAARKPAPKRR